MSQKWTFAGLSKLTILVNFMQNASHQTEGRVMLKKVWNYLGTLLRRLGILLGLSPITRNSMRGSTDVDEPSWLVIARGELGQEEIPGPEHNPRIIEYLSYLLTKFTRDEIPWCSAFICWCFVQVGIEPSRSGLARSWLRWGVALEEPRLGAVMIFSRGEEAWQGHVFLYTGEDSRYYFGLGGNQKNKVSISRQEKEKLLGIRWPKDI